MNNGIDLPTQSELVAVYLLNKLIFIRLGVGVGERDPTLTRLLNKNSEAGLSFEDQNDPASELMTKDLQKNIV